MASDKPKWPDFDPSMLPDDLQTVVEGALPTGKASLQACWRRMNCAGEAQKFMDACRAYLSRNGAGGSLGFTAQARHIAWMLTAEHYAPPAGMLPGSPKPKKTTAELVQAQVKKLKPDVLAQLAEAESDLKADGLWAYANAMVPEPDLASAPSMGALTMLAAARDDPAKFVSQILPKLSPPEKSGDKAKSKPEPEAPDDDPDRGSLAEMLGT